MNDATDRLLRRGEVEQIVGLKKTTIYRMMSAGTFPRPVSLSSNAVRWRLSDVNAWMAGQTVRPEAGVAA